MSQADNDMRVDDVASASKPLWTTPVIESYDLAEFTLSSRGNNPGDGAANHS